MAAIHPAANDYKQRKDRLHLALRVLNLLGAMSITDSLIVFWLSERAPFIWPEVILPGAIIVCRIASNRAARLIARVAVGCAVVHILFWLALLLLPLSPFVVVDGFRYFWRNPDWMAIARHALLTAIAVSMEVVCALILWRGCLDGWPNTTGFDESHEESRWRFSLWTLVVTISVVCVLLSRMADRQRYFGFSIGSTANTDARGEVWSTSYAMRNDWGGRPENRFPLFALIIHKGHSSGATVRLPHDIFDPIQEARLVGPDGIVLTTPTLFGVRQGRIISAERSIAFATWLEFQVKNPTDWSLENLTAYLDKQSDGQKNTD